MSTNYHYLSEEKQLELKCIADALTAPGKGILTADESTSTIGKRLQEQGMSDNEDTRRKWRLVAYKFLSHPRGWLYSPNCSFHNL